MSHTRLAALMAVYSFTQRDGKKMPDIEIKYRVMMTGKYMGIPFNISIVPSQGVVKVSKKTKKGKRTVTLDLTNAIEMLLDDTKWTITK